jgi:hypothetical protein
VTKLERYPSFKEEFNKNPTVTKLEGYPSFKKQNERDVLNGVEWTMRTFRILIVA